MPKMTDRTVSALTCPAGRKDVLYFDEALKGFGVRVTAQGTRTFILQYRAGKTVRRVVLGAFAAELTTAQARGRAEKLRGEVRDGRDPVAERAAAKAEAAAAEAAAKKAKAETAYTLARLVEDWDRLHLAGKRPSYRMDALRRLRLHLAGFMDRPASGISRAEAVRVLDQIAAEAGETTARRVMAYARAAYGWARKRDSVGVNPFHGLPQIGEEVRRKRALSDAEIGAIWRAADRLGPIHGGYARFLLLTLARREEVARMTWGEVSADLATWTLPAERAKNHTAHVVHLPEPARDILRNLPRMQGTDLVFATLGGKGLTAFSFIVRVLTKESKVTGWRLHDFRRSGVTALAGLKFPPHVCDKLLNHVQGTINGVAAIYQKYEFLPERAKALDAWAAHVLCHAEGKAAETTNVIPLRAAG